TGRSRRAAKDRQQGDHEGSGSRALLFVLMMTLAVINILYGFYHTFDLFLWLGIGELPFPPLVRIVGLLIGVASLLFLHWVHQTLGSQFSARLELKQDHTLITAGPYARIRHPMYTALYGFFLGTFFLGANLYLGALTLAISLVLHRRIAAEEQMMEETFGEDYRRYRTRTNPILPKV
ncbi:MAG: isoprenylcysteine carboxylmethyltransferase family protein, partial [Verrucomicrobiota bacterium]